jgi:DNA-binding XRE family transcriptional regulator
MNSQALKERRHKLGLTQRQLAHFLEVSTDAVYRWETGRLPILKARESALEQIEAKLKKRKIQSV